MNIQERIKKLQTLPEKQRLIVFFAVIAVFAVATLFWGIKFTRDGVSKIGESVKSIDLRKIDVGKPDIQTGAPNFQAEIPQAEIDDFVSGQSGDLFQKQDSDLDFISEPPKPEY